MRYSAEDLDPDYLAKAAREALERPRDAAFWDDRLYTTHGAVASWAERGDDILSESNYHAMMDAVNGAAAHADREDEGDVIDATCGHWLVGSLRQLFVRVYIDDVQTEYAPSFIEAARCALALQDYPILDESDYSEREYKAWESIMAEAIDGAARAHTDTPEDEREITERLHTRFWDGTAQSGESCSPDEVSWEAVQVDYDATRDAVMAERGQAWINDVRPGQLAAF